MDSPVTTANTSIPISKMVNDLFLQWLSLPDTRTTLTSALHSVRTNSKMPDPIPYSKVEFSLKCVYHGSIDSRRSTQHVVVAFRSLNISIHHLFPPVPRLPSSPRISSSNNQSVSENLPNIIEEKKPRSSKKTFAELNGARTATVDQQPVSDPFEAFGLQ